MAIGLLIGVANGVMVGKYGINPFLQTLSFLIIFQGARTALQTQPVTGLPQVYVLPGGTANIAIAIMLIAFVLFGIVLRYTRFGQAVYATGSDEHAAREVGISTERVIISVYAISGVLSALAGLMITGFIGIVPPLIGDGLVFQAFEFFLTYPYRLGAKTQTGPRSTYRHPTVSAVRSLKQSGRTENPCDTYPPLSCCNGANAH